LQPFSNSSSSSFEIVIVIAPLRKHGQDHRYTEGRTLSRVEAARDNPERLHLMLPKAQVPVAPTHWAFGQLASIVGAPASYLRQLPAPLAGINLQYGLTNHRAEQVKTFETEDGRTELRAVTGPDYGRYLNSQAVSPAAV
jgi:hypothetical protein